VTGQSGAEDAATDLARTTEHAVTYARRVASTARARNERHRAENAELIKQFGRLCHRARARRGAGRREKVPFGKRLPGSAVAQRGRIGSTPAELAAQPAPIG
jgi:hypothetical protein